MVSIGADALEEEYGSRLAVAEALILGRIGRGHAEMFALQLVTPVLLEAARIRLEALGLLTPEHIGSVSTKIP